MRILAALAIAIFAATVNGGAQHPTLAITPPMD